MDIDVSKRVENSLKRIDDKFSKLNQNLQDFEQIMKPVKEELYIR